MEKRYRVRNITKRVIRIEVPDMKQKFDLLPEAHVEVVDNFYLSKLAEIVGIFNGDVILEEVPELQDETEILQDETVAEEEINVIIEDEDSTIQDINESSEEGVGEEVQEPLEGTETKNEIAETSIEKPKKGRRSKNTDK